MDGDYYYGTGRRKSSVARVFLKPGKGGFVVNGKPVLREQWRRYRIKPNDEVIFLSRPLGGRGGTGKSVLGLVAIIALSAFAPWVGAALFPGSALLGALAGGAIGIGGPALMNALEGKPQCLP